jgi:hypothetical protein
MTEVIPSVLTSLDRLSRCNPDELFVPGSFKVLSNEEKGSASDTIIMLGKFKANNQSVAIKVNFPNMISDYYNYEDTGLAA